MSFRVGHWEQDMMGEITNTIYNNSDLSTAVEAVNFIIDEKIDTSEIANTIIKCVYDKLIDSKSMFKTLAGFNGKIGHTIDHLKLGRNNSWTNSQRVNLPITAAAYTTAPINFPHGEIS